MSLLTRIHIENLRNLVSVAINPAPRFNILHGLNGSGKTSFLEAVHYLSLGRSFRTRLNSRIIHHDAKQFSLFAQIQNREQLVPVGIERQLNGDARIRIAQENARSIFEITQLLPVRLLNPDSRELLVGGSKLRRQFVDWGVFHVEPTFLGHWQKAQRILKQRNAAIRSRASKPMIQVWDMELDNTAQIIDDFRKNYIAALLPIFQPILSDLLRHDPGISLSYKPGWDIELGLRKILEEQLSRDLELGYTRHGPQRADILLRVDNVPAHDVLSQGQQKLLVYALNLAQGILLRQQTDKCCVFLLDDLPAELDVNSRKGIATVLSAMDAQVFVTGVDRQALSDFEGLPGSAVFHVEQGEFAAAGSSPAA